MIWITPVKAKINLTWEIMCTAGGSIAIAIKEVFTKFPGDFWWLFSLTGKFLSLTDIFYQKKKFVFQVNNTRHKSQPVFHNINKKHFINETFISVYIASNRILIQLCPSIQWEIFLCCIFFERCCQFLLRPMYANDVF